MPIHSTNAGFISAMAPVKQGFGGGVEDRVASAVLRVLRRERMLDREYSVYDDECIVHCREGDEELFRDNKDLVSMLRGYVILPVEEYSKLGG